MTMQTKPTRDALPIVGSEWVFEPAQQFPVGDATQTAPIAYVTVVEVGKGDDDGEWKVRFMDHTDGAYFQMPFEAFQEQAIPRHLKEAVEREPKPRHIPCTWSAHVHDTIGTACSNCGHTNVVHPGHHNPSLSECAICLLLAAIPEEG